jgi:uncharacterized phage-associated protein
MAQSNKAYYKLAPEQLDKVGNAMVFLSTEIPRLPKTKLLKLLYLLDEFSVKKSGIPFFNLQYKVWKLGPVATDIFIELSDRLTRFDEYIRIESEDNKIYIYPKTTFCDDEFSDNDIELLSFVAKEFKSIPGRDLVDHTHRPNSLWRTTAERNNVYHELENGEINHTDIILKLGELVQHDKHKKSIYQHYIEEN